MNYDQAHPKPAVLLTGSTGGIGNSCVQALLQNGFHVFAGVRESSDTSMLPNSTDAELSTVVLDVTSIESINRARTIIEKELQGNGLYALINNAGVTDLAPLEIMPPDVLRNIIDVNLIGPMMITRAFLPLIRKAGGKIINIGSIARLLPFPYFVPYCASKSALHGFSDALRLELRSFGIDVVLIEPGNVATGMWGKGIDSLNDTEKLQVLDNANLYSNLSGVIRNFMHNSAHSGVSPDLVAKYVTHALRGKGAKPRYTVGVEAKLMYSLAYLMPTRLRDWLISKLSKLPSRNDL